MVSSRTAAVLWLVAGSSSAFLVPFMTDQLLLAVFAIGAIVGIGLAVASLLLQSGRLAKWSAATGAAWLAVFATITLANLGDPIEYLVPVVWIAVFGAAAGLVSYRIAGAPRPTTADMRELGPFPLASRLAAASHSSRPSIGIS
jgi:hypothetical protein